MSFFSAIGDALGIAAAPATGGASLLPSLISAGASLAGGLMTNSANASLASQQEAFQADMSGTAYQRAVADMEKAGLNPMLAYSNGPASTPSGATIAMQNPVTPAVSSALEAATTQASVNKAVADTDLSKALTVKAAADAKSSLATAAQAEANTDISRASLAEKQVESHISSAIDKFVAPISHSAGQVADQAPSIWDKIKSGVMGAYDSMDKMNFPNGHPAQ